MTDETRSACPSQIQTEPVVPEGYNAVNVYPDGFIAFQAQPPSLREQLQVKLAEEKQPDQDIKAKEEVSKWERRVKFALQAGGVVVLATIAVATAAGCVPGMTGALPVTIVPDSATGNAPRSEEHTSELQSLS